MFDPVRHVRLGSSGPKVSRVGPGLRVVASARDLPPAQVALAWALGRPAVTAPIVGASKVAHLDDAVAALDVVLSPEEVASLEAPYRPHVAFGY